MTRINLKELSFAQIDQLAATMGQPKFRAKQICDWLYAKNAVDIASMSNLPKEFREELAVTHTAKGFVTVAKRVAVDGTIKYLFALDDGLTVETVYIPEEKRNTVCVSTQVGCKFKCAFCATGMMGFSRNLTQAEILNQVIEARRDAGDVTNVVFMGMGEPLDNFAAVTRALGIMHSPGGLNIGARRITVSTVGLPAQIDELGKTGLKTNLAISLHAANDVVRSRLMPVGKKYPVAAIMKACARYPLQHGRVITMEVILFDGVNDHSEDAQALIRALRTVKAKVNLILFNPVAGAELRPSPREKVEKFQKALMAAEIDCTIRLSRGGEIEAACGQLKTTFSK